MCTYVVLYIRYIYVYILSMRVYICVHMSYSCDVLDVYVYVMYMLY